MATFDLILRGGTVASHDGIGTADVGVRDGRTAEVGDLGRAASVEPLGSPAHERDRARQARPQATAEHERGTGSVRLRGVSIVANVV